MPGLWCDLSPVDLLETMASIQSSKSDRPVGRSDGLKQPSSLFSTIMEVELLFGLCHDTRGSSKNPSVSLHDCWREDAL